MSRDAYAKVIYFRLSIQVYLQNHPAKDKSLPGPGQYSEVDQFGKSAKKVSIAPKTLCDGMVVPLISIAALNSTRHNPGPGAYEPKTSINQTGKYVLSNMHSTLSPSFS